MFKPIKAASIQEYFEMLPPDRRASLEFLDALIRKTAPSLRPVFAYNMLGYGNFKYRNSKKELVDWPTIGLASQKNYISLYICSTDKGEYIAEKHKDTLGKVSVGKSCIRFKKIEDLNLEALKAVIKLAEKSPGYERD
jgi:hypothetical protein